jgi:hypothetical protein
MAIFGIAATQDDRDLLDEFLALGAVCVVFSEAAAPSLHTLLCALKAGDLVYIKSHEGSGELTIKAIGVVRRAEVKNYDRTGRGVPVRWAWQGEQSIGKLEDKGLGRSAAFYEELHPTVHTAVIELLVNRGSGRGSLAAPRSAQGRAKPGRP